MCSLIDNSAARLKYDQKFKPKKFKRKDRNHKDAIQIGYIEDDLSKAVPQEIGHVVHTSREYLGIEYTRVPILLQKALLEVIERLEKIEKFIKELQQ